MLLKASFKKFWEQALLCVSVRERQRQRDGETERNGEAERGTEREAGEGEGVWMGKKQQNGSDTGTDLKGLITSRRA